MKSGLTDSNHPISSKKSDETASQSGTIKPNIIYESYSILIL